MSYAGRVPTEIMADLGIRGMQNPTVNLEQVCNDFSKNWLQSSSAVHAKVSLVSLPPHYPNPNLSYILKSVQQDQEDFL